MLENGGDSVIFPRFALPQDIEGTAGLLASDESSYCTGGL
jgi:hypothetical protein